MKNTRIVLALFVGFLAAFTNASFAAEKVASAYVSASPAYYDFGALPEGQSRIMSVTFMNQTRDAIPYFSVNCSGDFSAFSCLSFCYSLPAYGSCSVQVRFEARSGDGQRKSMSLYGQGAGVFVTSTISGTDARRP